MTSILSEDILAQLEGFIARHLGLHFPKDRYRNLERGIALAAKELHFADPNGFAESLLASPVIGDELDILASSLTVGETYFFRERRIFEILEQHILPEWICARRANTRCLNIWSAGCCTGEEAYTLAMLIHKMIPDLASWHIKIYATDINARFLEKAAAGIYSDWSFRGTPGGVKERYFKKTREGRYEILSHLKEMVKFARLNLVENQYPSWANLTAGMDLILCRNVLMYFIPWQVNKVIDFFYRCLIDGGWLIVSPSEISCLQASPFTMINFPGAILHQKREAKTVAPEASVPSERGFFPEIDTRCFLPLGSPQKNEIVPEPAARSEELEVRIPTSPQVQGIGQDSQPYPEQLWEKVEGPELPASDSPFGTELVTLYEEGRYTEVADRLSGWLSQGELKPEAVFPGRDPVTLLIKSYANLGNLDAALTWCDWGIGKDKLNPLLRYLHAVILQERGQMEEALVSLKQALYLNPNFILAHFTLGNVTRKLGHIKESEKHFANAMRLLNSLRADETVPESDGMTVESLQKTIPAVVSKEKRA